MFNSNLAYTNNTYEIPEWDYIVSEMANVFRLTESEKSKLYSNRVAKLIAAIPFEAGCNNPERTAISHLGLFLMEIHGFQKFCAHLPSDDADIFTRLERISNFNGGNPDIIEHGMALLAYIMLEGYKKSKKADLENNVYNPLNSHTWNYSLLKIRLNKIISKISCPTLDSLFLAEPMTVGWW